MSAGPLTSAACGAMLLLGVLASPSSVPPTTAPIKDVLLSEPGAGFVLASEAPGPLDSLTRTFENDHAHLVLNGFSVTDPPGVSTLFQLLKPKGANFDIVPEPALDLAAWIVPTGAQLGEGFASLIFGARDHLFVFTLTVDDASSIDPLSFVRGLADAQIATTGRLPAAKTPRQPTVDDARVEAMLPDTVPPEYKLTTSATVTGTDELKEADKVARGVADFLNQHSTTATRVWSDDSGQLLGAVSVTKYPYEIFAAASLGSAAAPGNTTVTSRDAIDDVPGVLSFTGTGPSADQVGTAFRRGDLFALVLVKHEGNVPASRATALAEDLTRLTAAGLPSGDSGSYTFPGTPSKLLGLALSAGLVTTAASGSAAVARLRARRARRRWKGGPLPPPTRSGEATASTAISLDHYATLLRHRGWVIALGQLAAVNVCIVALAGDFGWRGVFVAAVALVVGLLLTHLWQRHELRLLGSAGRPRQYIAPRPGGAVVGLISLAVLGLGVGFLLKGLRYIVLRPSLAQLRWSDLLGIAPRTVGFVFAIGGFVVAAFGGWLFRVARSLSRSGTKRVLEVDRRPAALYLRSFEDDSVPLPTIVSARRPLFELFSLRGTDPFEESVAWELNSYGPVVAVGRPGRSLASLGAAREHLSDETWRDQVAVRMDEAGIIAIAIGETDGLVWEINHVVANGHIPKTFFVFPPVAPAAIDRRWDQTAAALIAAGQPVGTLPVPSSLVHTVRLDSDGSARVTYAHRRDEATYRTAVDFALEPASLDGDTLSQASGATTPPH